MGKAVGYEGCPRCMAQGRDRHRDNLVKYDDGSGHCFSCGYHPFAKLSIRKEQKHVDENKAVLPDDFTRSIPAEGWKWLLQYGLPYTYWLPHCGYSETHERLVFTVGKPTVFSIGRYIGNDERERAKSDKTFRKWRIWGDRSGFVEILGAEKGGPLTLVEDLISAHKVAQVSPAICLFGTKISPEVIAAAAGFKRPVALWLDADQYALLAPKINRLQTFLDVPVRYVKTDKDPKRYSTEEINETLRSSK